MYDELELDTLGDQKTADDLLTCGLAAGSIISNAEARTVYAHIGRRLVGGFAEDFFQHRFQNREDFDITVVVDSHLTVSIEMEWVDHVDIVEVGCGSFVCYVYRVLEREIPDREGLELGVAGFDAPFVLVQQSFRCLPDLRRTGSADEDQQGRAVPG